MIKTISPLLSRIFLLLCGIFVAELIIMAYVIPFFQGWSHWGKVLIDPLFLLIMVLPFVYLLVKAEQTLQLHTQIISQTHDSIITTRLDGTITSWNKGAERIYGYTDKEMIGKHISTLYSEERHEFLISNILSPLMERGFIEIKDECVTKSGQRIYIHLSLSLTRDSSGNPKGIIGYSVDITEREQALEKLLHTQFSMDKTRDAVYWMSPDASFFYVNDSATKALGYTKEELLTMSVDDIAPGRLEDIWPGYWKELIKKGSIVFESVHKRKDGSLFPVELSVNYLKFGDKEFNCAFARDITERKSAEEALKQSEERYRAVVEAQTEYIVRWRDDNTISFANDAFLTFFGKNKVEVIGKSFLPFISEDEKENVEKRKLRLTPDNPESTEIHQILMRDGNIRWHEWTDRLISSKGDYGQEFQSVGRDITDRVLAEESLKQSEEKFSMIFHSSPDSLLLTIVEDGRIIDLNEVFERQSGYSRDEVIGKTTIQLNSWAIPEDREKYADLLLKNGQVRDFEAGILNKAGNVVPVSMSAKLIDLVGVPHILTIIQNLSERKKAEMSTRLASIGELAAGVAHEINTPISSIMLNAQMLYEYTDMPDNEKQRLYHAIGSNSERVADIVKKLLSFARSDEKKKNLGSIGIIVEEALSLVKHQIIKSGANLDVDIPDSLPKVFVNRQQLQQVFLNIINNARYSINQKQYTNDEEKRLEIKGELVEFNNMQYILLTFHDSGKGIPANVLDKIMLPFFTTKPEGSGTGLGLSISHGIMKDHSGMLEFESKEGEYTKVMVYLPLEVSTK